MTAAPSLGTAMCARHAAAPTARKHTQTISSGSSWTRTGSGSLRAVRTPAAAATTAASARPSDRGTRTSARSRSVRRRRARRPAPDRGSRRTAAAPARPGTRPAPSGGPSTAAIRTAGGKPSSVRAASSWRACHTGSHRTSACTGASADSASTTTRPAVGAGPDQGGRGHPPAQRLLGGAQVGPAEQGPAVEQQRGAVPAVGDRLGARRGHHQRRPPVDLGEHLVRPRRCSTGTPGNARPSSSAVRRAPTTMARSRRDPQAAHRNGGVRRAAPAAVRGARHVVRVPPRQRQRARAAPAAGRGPALLAGQRRARTRARHLHQHRRAGRQRGPRRVERHRRDPGRARRRVPGQLPVVSPRPPRSAARRPAASSRAATISGAHRESTSSCASAVRREARRPAATRRLSAPAGISTSRTCGYGARGSACRSSPSSQTTNTPGSRTGANDARPRADHDPRARRAAPPATAGTARPARGRRTAPPRAVLAGQRHARRVQPGHVAVVGHDQQRAPAGRPPRSPPASASRAGQSSPGSACHTACGPPPGPQRVQERRPARVAAPSRRAGAPRGSCGRFGRRLGLDPRVPRRDRQPQHVDHGAGVPVGDRPGQRRDLRGEHRLGGHHPVQERRAGRRSSDSADPSSRKPSTSCPANRTRTRQPGTAARRARSGTR